MRNGKVLGLKEAESLLTLLQLRLGMSKKY